MTPSDSTSNNVLRTPIYDHLLRHLGRSVAIFSSLFLSRPPSKILPSAISRVFQCRTAAALRASPLFDFEWYKLTHQDIAEAQRDPWRHYSQHGWRQGRSPSPFFDAAWYLERYPDAIPKGMDPLTHYFMSGIHEERAIRFLNGDIAKISSIGELSIDRNAARTEAERGTSRTFQFSEFPAHQIWTMLFIEQLALLRKPDINLLVRAKDFFIETANTTGGMPNIVFSVAIDPRTSNEKEGYVQRISAIDNALQEHIRLYLHLKEKPTKKWSVSNWRPGATVITLSTAHPEATAIMNTFIHYGHIYMHSVYPLRNAALRTIVALNADRVTLDAHGAVPEECVMQRDYKSALKFQAIESDIIQKVARIVVVTDAMRRHFLDKYKINMLRTVTCPIFNYLPTSEHLSQNKSTKIHVVYVGGTQVWQSVDDIVSAITARLSDSIFTVLTPDVGYFQKKLKERGINPSRVDIRSVPPDQVQSILAKQDFGFLLRNDSVVNRVACPTKLLEYLAADVIPILDSPEIGDFVSTGMRYIRLGDFLNGELPRQEERQSMVKANRAVYQRLRSIALAGLSEIMNTLRMDANSYQ